jgi:hypothetical protein
MIPIHWTSRTEIPNLEALLESHRHHGGAIVEYKRVWAALVFASSSPRLEWVAPGQSRVLAGLKHTLFSAALGWWSLGGFFMTIQALVQNLMGGIEVTGVFTAPAPAPGQPFDARALRELDRARRAQAVIFAMVLLLILAALFWFVALPPMRKAGWL